MRQQEASLNASEMVVPDWATYGFGLERNEENRDIALQEYAHELASIKFALDQSTIIAVTDKHGDIVYANEAFCKISKYSREELLGQNHRIINSGYHPKAFFKALWYTIGHGKVWRGEIRNKAKDGTFYWVDTAIFPFRDVEGKIYQYVSIRHDITRQKLAEEQLSQLNDQLEQKVRERTVELENANQALKGFTSMVSHDLKSPARKTNMFSQILLEEYAGTMDEKCKDYFQRIVSNSQHMTRLIDDFFRLSNIQQGKLHSASVNLSLLAHDILSDLKSQDPDRKVEVRITHNLIAEGDEAFLKILLGNLLENAWKFTSQREEALIEFGVTQSKQQKPVFFIRDNGTGFDMAEAVNLFQPFQRFHSGDAFPGSGIGLAIAQQIIQRHHGAIWAESKPNEGTTVYFTITL